MHITLSNGFRFRYFPLKSAIGLVRDAYKFQIYPDSTRYPDFFYEETMHFRRKEEDCEDLLAYLHLSSDREWVRLKVYTSPVLVLATPSIHNCPCFITPHRGAVVEGAGVDWNLDEGLKVHVSLFSELFRYVVTTIPASKDDTLLWTFSVSRRFGVTGKPSWNEESLTFKCTANGGTHDNIEHLWGSVEKFYLFNQMAYSIGTDGRRMTDFRAKMDIESCSVDCTVPTYEFRGCSNLDDMLVSWYKASLSA